MNREIVKMCAKCQEPKPLVKHRSICYDCNLARKRAVAAQRQATPEGREANRARAAAFRTTEEGRAYGREYAQNLAPEQVARRNELARERYTPTPRKPGRTRKEQLAAWVLTPQGRASILLQGVRRRAKMYAHQIDALDRSRIAKILEAGKCQATGIPFDFSPHEGRGAHPWAPSIDRKDSSKGYTFGNIHVVCWAYNVAKAGWSEAVLLRLARAIVDANR